MFKMAERSCDEKLLTNFKRATKVYSDKQNFRSSLNIASITVSVVFSSF